MSTPPHGQHPGTSLAIGSSSPQSPHKSHLNTPHSRSVVRNASAFVNITSSYASGPQLSPTLSRLHNHRDRRMNRSCISRRLGVTLALMIGFGSILLLMSETYHSPATNQVKGADKMQVDSDIHSTQDKLPDQLEFSKNSQAATIKATESESDKVGTVGVHETRDHFGGTGEATDIDITDDQKEDNHSQAYLHDSKSGFSTDNNDRSGSYEGEEQVGSGDDKEDLKSSDGHPLILNSDEDLKESLVQDTDPDEVIDANEFPKTKGTIKLRGRKQKESRFPEHNSLSKGGTDARTGVAGIAIREPDLPASHPCARFTLPPPPADRKRTGPRACDVCYLSIKAAAALQPPKHHPTGEKLEELSYVTQEDFVEQNIIAEGGVPRFAGHQSWKARQKSFSVARRMKVHCGFVGSGFTISEEDTQFMHACTNIVVASAIFGAYDVLQQPRNIGPRARRNVCFIMFVDEDTLHDLHADGSISGPEVHMAGLWRIILVKDIPYNDPRRTGKVPKLLLHRLFPNVQFSIWMDAKLELVVDPYRILERFLWRGNYTFAISKHYKRFDVFTEAEANKAAGKYDNASIDAQIEVYRKDGLTPYTEAKLPITSDVPEGCLILREHTPVSNLFSCLWFNEVERFTSRDQLSFGYTRDKLLSSTPWQMSMFLDCERRNFVVQAYHKDLLLERGTSLKKRTHDPTQV